jgi:ABC-type nitrate/sulfonate/bicarbonate transport system permease component
MKKFVRAGVGIGVTLLGWQLLALTIDAPLLVPSPASVAKAAWAMIESGELLRDIAISLQRLLVALVVGVPLGAVLGCAMGRWMLVDALLEPFVRMFNAIPAIALVPFSLLWFGVTETSRYALLIYTVVLAVLISARQGVRAVPPLRVKVGAVLGVTGIAAFFRIVLPSCVPVIIAGIRTAIGLGVMVVVVAEMLGAENGVGYLIMESRSHFNVANMAVGVTSLGILSLVLDRLFVNSIERFAPRWSVRRRIR